MLLEADRQIAHTSQGSFRLLPRPRQVECVVATVEAQSWGATPDQEPTKGNMASRVNLVHHSSVGEIPADSGRPSTIPTEHQSSHEFIGRNRQ